MSDERRRSSEEGVVHPLEEQTDIRLNLAAGQLLGLWPVSACAHACVLLVLAAARAHPQLLSAWATAALLEAMRVLIARRQVRAPADEPARRMRLLWLVLLCESAVMVLVQLAAYAQGSDALRAGLTLASLLLLMLWCSTTGWDIRAFVGCGTPVALMACAASLARGGLYGVADAVAVATGYALAMLWLSKQDREFWIGQQALREGRARHSEFTRARREAGAADNLKMRFFAAASHDLRQPLHALAVNATTLQLLASRQADPVLKELSNSINSSLGHSDHLLDSLLDISLLDAHALPPQPDLVDMSDVLEALHAEFSPLAEQQGLDFPLETEQGAKVHSDREMLTRILRNLLSNAMKFTPCAGRVGLESRIVGSEVILLVRDTGPGIPFDMRDRIFEEFCQLDNPARDRSKGLGLGLSIVKRLTALLEISVQVDSVPGRGTCFSVRLPRVPLEDCGEAVQSETVPQGDEVELLRGHSVLAVDDEPEVLRSLHMLLREIGVTMASATDLASSERAIDEGFRPTLLILDFRLGNENGLDVLARMRARLGHIPALLLSGDTVDGRLRECVGALTVVEYKPLNGQRLVSALARVASAPARNSPE
ncbi:MAG: ATP-binding protein [Pseudomonadota bacterium]